MSANKRLKTGGTAAEASPDLLALYEGDLGKEILSYATGSDLCSLDAVSQRFQKLTAGPWKKATRERFGMKNGKEGWKLGTSFLREPTYVLMTDAGDHGYGDSYAGTARLASNGSILVAVTDDPYDPYGRNNERPLPDPENSEEEEENMRRERTYPGERNGMGLRDCFTLNYIRTLSSPIPNCRVAICGWPDQELVVTSSSAEVCVRRGQHGVSYINGQASDGDGIPIIGNETHLIIGRRDYVEIHEMRDDRGGPELSWSESCGLGAEQGGKITCLSWGPTKHTMWRASEFAVGLSDEIFVFGFRRGTSGLSNLQIEAYVTESVDTWGFEIRSVSLTEDFIIGASRDKKIHVWGRGTGGLMHIDLCDVEEDEDEDDEIDADDDIFHPLPLSCHGNILVTTSRRGYALCIWDIKEGKLLKRYNHAAEESNVDMLPDGVDCTDMTYLEPLNGFACMSGGMNVWAFPCNERQAEMAQSIRRRESMLRKLYSPPALEEIAGVIADKALKEKVESIVENSDKQNLTVKGVRETLEDWLDVDLTNHKDTIRAMVMEAM